MFSIPPARKGLQQRNEMTDHSLHFLNHPFGCRVRNGLEEAKTGDMKINQKAVKLVPGGNDGANLEYGKV